MMYSKEKLSQLNLKKELNEMLTNKLLNVFVARTLPFEYVEKSFKLFTKVYNTKSFSYMSDYDPSLNISIDNSQTDIIIFWMDWRLYMDKMSPADLIEWLKNRISDLNIQKPLLINNWPSFWNITERQFAANVSKRGWIYEFNYLLEDMKQQVGNIEIIDLNFFASQLGSESYDLRNDKISNYPLSNQLTLQVSRHIALNLIPAMIAPRLKAIVVDLDNTLYAGVLGEDGIEQLQVTESHIQLQQTLKVMKENGILLAISSKNDEQDVLKLLEERKDCILKKEDFTFIEANWNSKASNIELMAKKFNFDVSAMLFIDDNPAEIAHVKNELPTIHTILADATGVETVHRLLNYPYLYSRVKDESADTRQKDILANQTRQELQQKSGDGSSYLSSLQMKIKLFEDDSDHVYRVYEMGHKTNQFNLALKRFDEETVKQKSVSKHYKIFTVALSDILNDSGIIASYIVKIDGDKAIFEEVLFSCRALGRKVEDASLRLIILKLKKLGICSIQFDTIEGPRNNPALDWYQSIHTSDNVDDILEVLNKKLEDYPAEVYWQNEGIN